MAYTVNDIDKILEFKTWDTKQKVDELLRIDAALYCNLGTDSTKQERAKVKSNSRSLYLAIKKLDRSSGEMFLRCQDLKS
jgi:hypothetical protein